MQGNLLDNLMQYHDTCIFNYKAFLLVFSELIFPFATVTKILQSNILDLTTSGSLDAIL